VKTLTDEFNDSHGFFDAISQLPNDDAIGQLSNDDAVGQLPNTACQLPSDLSMSVLEGMTQDWVSSPLVASTPRYSVKGSAFGISFVPALVLESESRPSTLI
jgi:hypothetical protein